MSTWPNMPVDATVLFDGTLSSKSGLLDVYNSWISASDGNEPISPPSCYKSVIYAGNTSGGSQVHYNAPQTYTDMFVAMSWRTNAGFQGRTTANKMFFVRGPGVNGFFGMNGSTGGPYVLGFGHNTASLNNSHIFPADLGLGYSVNNVSSGSLPVNTWTRIEVYIKKSTTSTSRDGILRYWVNGVLCANYTTVNYAPNGLNEWVWSETWDGTVTNPTPSVDWEHYLGHLFIATGGTPSSGGGGTTPSTPTLSSLTPATVSLAPGNAQTLTIGMSGAVSTSTSVVLSSSNTSVATVPANATIPSGNSSTTSTVTAASAGTATITASLGGVSRTSSVTVTASSGGTSSPTTYTYASQFSGVQGQNQWSYRDTGGNLLVYNAGASRWEGDELYLAIWSTGFVHGYSGSNKGAVLRWTAPAAGSVAVSGTALLYDSSGQGSFTVNYNSSTAKFGPQTMTYGVAYPYSFTQAVAAGDVIDFIMNGSSRATNDNTQLDPVIVFTPTTSGGSTVTISSMTPSSGTIGSSVTIVGTGFSATAINNTITVNGVPATITSASTTQLVFTVPITATTGLVNVSTSTGSASAGTFTVTDPVTPDVPPASNFGGSAMLLLVLP